MSISHVKSWKLTFHNSGDVQKYYEDAAIQPLIINSGQPVEIPGGATLEVKFKKVMYESELVRLFKSYDVEFEVARHRISKAKEDSIDTVSEDELGVTSKRL